MRRDDKFLNLQETQGDSQCQTLPQGGIESVTAGMSSIATKSAGRLASVLALPGQVLVRDSQQQEPRVPQVPHHDRDDLERNHV